MHAVTDWCQIDTEGVRIQINTSCSVCYYTLNCFGKPLHPECKHKTLAENEKRSPVVSCVEKKSLSPQRWNTGLSFTNLSVTFCAGCLNVCWYLSCSKYLLKVGNLKGQLEQFCTFKSFLSFSFSGCMCKLCPLSLLSVATNRGKSRWTRQWSSQVCLLFSR